MNHTACFGVHTRDYNLAIDEWVQRGYRNNMLKMKISGKIAYPRWFGRDEFHAAHRSNMLR